MRYKPKSIAALHIALGGLPVKMRVEVDPDVGVSPAGDYPNMVNFYKNLVMAGGFLHNHDDVTSWPFSTGATT